MTNALICMEQIYEKGPTQNLYLAKPAMQATLCMVTGYRIVVIGVRYR